LPTNCRLASRFEIRSRVKVPKSQDDCRPGSCLTTWSWRAVRQQALSRFTNPGRGCHARPQLPCIFGPRCRGKYTQTIQCVQLLQYIHRYCTASVPIAPSSFNLLHPNRIPASEIEETPLAAIPAIIGTRENQKKRETFHLLLLPCISAQQENDLRPVHHSFPA
jgi:hypothetical protein